jgi:hypothetical protein
VKIKLKLAGTASKKKMSMPNQGLPIEGLLLAVSQIGIALGGFAGLAASFWPSEHSRALRRSPALRIVLDFSFGTLAFGLLPFLVYELTLSQSLAWRVCSLLLFLFLASELALWMARIRRGLHIIHPRMFYWLFVLPNLLFAIGELANVFFSAPLRGYTIGLLWLLAPPVVQFYLFIVDQDYYLRSRRSRLRRRRADRHEAAAKT